VKPKRPFAVFDIDGTLVRWQLYHAVADELVKLGYFDAKAFAPIRDARMDWKTRTGKESFRSYEIKLVRLYEKLLRQLTIDQFGQAAQAVFDEHKDQVYTYTRDLISSLKDRGFVLLAISNSQVEIVSKIAKYYGFDDYVGAIYEHKKGQFTGKSTVHLHDKDQVLQNMINKHRLSLEGSIAVGDSASDIPMLALVENPIAFNPEQKLFDEAKKRGWPIVIERKNVVYELEKRHGSYRLF